MSRLRAHRLSRGWTLVEAVSQFQRLCVDEQLAGPRLDMDQLRVWETTDRRPVASTIDLLCRLYETNARDLGLDVVADYTPPGAGVPRAQHSGDGPLDDIRRLVDRTLAAATVSDGQLDLLEERLLQHRRRYVVWPPETILPDLVADMQDVRHLAEQRQPAAVQRRLSRMTALLATLIADALMKLGQLRSAAAWYATARTAADDCAELEIQARVRVQAAILPYYYGPLDSAIHLTRDAQQLLVGRVCEAAAFASIAHARALARRGDAHGADAGLRTAHEVLAGTVPSRVPDALTFPARRLLLYTSGTLTYLGRTRLARHAQREALALYPPRGGGIDPALLHLEEAICLVREHCLTEACQLAGATYLALPPEQRTRIITARVRHVVDALPARMRLCRAARELGEILALPNSRT
ncbi:hypothetical protein P8605_01175 [Streptomyces sp. T-3]|nr:hypothetical protein [Streptomyces sp. T-3]